MENKPWRLVDLSVVTQTRDAESKEESYHDVAEPATGYSNLVNPRLPKNTQDREIFQDRNLDAIWVKPFLSLSLSHLFQSSLLFHANPRLEPERKREEARLDRYAGYEKFEKAGEKKWGDGKGIRLEFEASWIREKGEIGRW